MLNLVIPVVLEDLAAGGTGPRLPHLLPQVLHHACLMRQNSTLVNLEYLATFLLNEQSNLNGSTWIPIKR